MLERADRLTDEQLDAPITVPIGTAAIRRPVVLGAYEKLGITDLLAGDLMEGVAQPA